MITRLAAHVMRRGVISSKYVVFAVFSEVEDPYQLYLEVAPVKETWLSSFSFDDMLPLFTHRIAPKPCRERIFEPHVFRSLHGLDEMWCGQVSGKGGGRTRCLGPDKGVERDDKLKGIITNWRVLEFCASERTTSVKRNELIVSSDEDGWGYGFVCMYIHHVHFRCDGSCFIAHLSNRRARVYERNTGGETNPIDGMDAATEDGSRWIFGRVENVREQE